MEVTIELNTVRASSAAAAAAPAPGCNPPARPANMGSHRCERIQLVLHQATACEAQRLVTCVEPARSCLVSAGTAESSHLGHPDVLRVAAAALERGHALYELAPASGEGSAAWTDGCWTRHAAPTSRWHVGRYHMHAEIGRCSGEPGSPPCCSSAQPALQPGLPLQHPPTYGRRLCRRPAARAPPARCPQSMAALLRCRLRLPARAPPSAALSRPPHFLWHTKGKGGGVSWEGSAGGRQPELPSEDSSQLQTAPSRVGFDNRKWATAVTGPPPHLAA